MGLFSILSDLFSDDSSSGDAHYSKSNLTDEQKDDLKEVTKSEEYTVQDEGEFVTIKENKS